MGVAGHHDDEDEGVDADPEDGCEHAEAMGVRWLVGGAGGEGDAPARAFTLAGVAVATAVWGGAMDADVGGHGSVLRREGEGDAGDDLVLVMLEPPIVATDFTGIGGDG